MTNPLSPPFYGYLREERQFSFVLAHLLMQAGPALERFIGLVNESVPEAERWDLGSGLDEVEVYVEFAFLRDKWASLSSGPGSLVGAQKRDANEAKRAYIDTLLRKIPELRVVADELKSEDPAEFNGFFMGKKGLDIRADIASPALWSVTGLKQKFESRPEQFIKLCELKWAFRIKPDIVLIRPGDKPICVETKLESSEGIYPSGGDAKAVDEVMKKVTRRGQLEIQQFMFATLLDMPCIDVVVQKWPAAPGRNGRVLTWSETFAACDGGDGFRESIPFVRRLVESNIFLKPKS